MTQSHLIVKEEGICIYRVPDPPRPEDLDPDIFSSNYIRDVKEAYNAKVKQAQSSAILCEDQEIAKEIIEEFLFQGDPSLVNIEIGSIYPVPGIEFKEIEVGCARHESTWQCKHDDCKEMVTVARLIEHTAEKHSIHCASYTSEGLEKRGHVPGKCNCKSESPEIDKEQDELLNFLKWFNDGRWYKDMETFNWRRNFAYKEPEILTSEELVKLYRSPINLKP